MRMKKVSEEKQIVVDRRSFPILGILGLIFVTLKLTGHITWSWWWVLAPFWAPFAIVGAFIAFVFLMAALIAIFSPKV